MMGNINSLKGLMGEDSVDEADIAEGPELRKTDKKKEDGANADEDDVGKKKSKSDKGKDDAVEEDNPLLMTEEIAKAQRVWRKHLASLQSLFNEAMPNCDTLLAEARPESDNPHIRLSLSLCEGRAIFARAFLDETTEGPAKLAALIEKAKVGRPHQPVPLAAPPLVQQIVLEGLPPTPQIPQMEPELQRMSFDIFKKFKLQGKADAEESEEETIKDDWEKLVANADVGRDNNGPGDALQLDVTVGMRPAAAITAAHQVVPPGVHRSLPPCRMYEDLRTFSELQEMGEALATCDSMLEIKEHIASMGVFRMVVKGLFVSWKTSISELDKAIKGWKAAVEQSVKDAAKAKAKTAPATLLGKRKKGNGSLDVCLERGTAMASFDTKATDWKSNGGAAEIFQSSADVTRKMQPFVLTGVDITWAAEGTTDAVGISFKDFAADFAVCQWRDTAERASRANMNPEHKDNDAMDFLQSRLRQFCPAGSILASALPEKSPLKGDMCVANFGMKTGSTHVSLEKSSLWTSRLSTAGTRTVAVMNLGEVKAHLKSEGLVGKDPKAWLKDATPTAIMAFCKAHPCSKSLRSNGSKSSPAAFGNDIGSSSAHSLGCCL